MDDLRHYLRPKVEFHHDLCWVLKIYLGHLPERHGPMSRILGNELWPVLEVDIANRHFWWRGIPYPEFSFETSTDICISVGESAGVNGTRG